MCFCERMFLPRGHSDRMWSVLTPDYTPRPTCSHTRLHTQTNAFSHQITHPDQREGFSLTHLQTAGRRFSSRWCSPGTCTAPWRSPAGTWGSRRRAGTTHREPERRLGTQDPLVKTPGPAAVRSGSEHRVSRRRAGGTAGLTHAKTIQSAA